MNLDTYRIPDEDRETFNTLPLDVRAQIQGELRIFWTVDHTPCGQRGAAWRAAIELQQALLGQAGLAFTLKRQALYAHRQVFHATGEDWAVLVDKRKVTDWDEKARRRTGNGRGLPPAFCEYLFGLAQNNSRSASAAIQELYRLWEAGEEIPGYGRWTSWFSENFPSRQFPAIAPRPDGWGHRNLLRCFQDRAALELARRGIAAATSMLPTVIRTRAGLRPLEYIVLDDWRADFLVYVPGCDEPVELNGIICMDVASATCLRFGLRPSLPTANGSYEGLKRVDAKSLVCELLLKWGYPRDYIMNIIVENGTATITPADAAAIEQVTNGRVKIHWTSMISGSVFGWADKPVGNFRGKSWLESFINLLHNACGNLPGQIGAHYQQRPARVQAQEREACALLKAQAALPSKLRDTLNYRLPFLSVAEARVALDFVFHFLNNRDEHNLEGFEEVLKFRVEDTDPWRPVTMLLEKGYTRDMVMALKPRPRIQAPIERFNTLCADVRFQRFSMSSAPLLLAEHRQVTIEKDGEVNIGSKSSPRYYRDRQNAHLAAGNKFLAYVGSQDDSWIHLTDLREGYVCSVPRADRIRIGDTEALSVEIAAKTRQMNDKIRKVNALNLGAAKRLADVDHNNRLLDQHLEAVELLAAPAIDVETDAADGVAGVLNADRAIAQFAHDKAAAEAATAERIRNTSGSVDELMPGHTNPEEDDQPTDTSELALSHAEGLIPAGATAPAASLTELFKHTGETR